MLVATQGVARVVTPDDVPTFDGLVPTPLLPGVDATDEEWAEGRSRVLEHPILSEQLVAEDTVLVPILIEHQADYWQELALANLLRKTLDDHPPPAGVRGEITGRTSLWLEHREAFDRDHKRLQFWSFGLVTILALVLLRNFPAAAIAGLSPALGLMWTWGALGWLGEDVGGLTKIVTPVLLMMVGFTDSMHLMLAMRQGRRAGLSARDAARRMAIELGGACCLTSLTTAVGFASLMTASSEMLVGFGLACSLGSLLTLAAVVLVVPLACSTPIGNHLGEGRREPRSGAFFEGLVARILPRARAVALVGIVATAWLTVLASGLKPDDSLAGDLPANSRAGQGLEWASEAFGGTLPLMIFVDPAEVASLPAELAAVEEILAAEPDVGSISSALDLWAAVPESLHPMIPPEVRTTWLSEDGTSGLVHFRLPDMGTADLRPVFDRLTTALEERSAEAPVSLLLAGQAVEDARGLDEVTNDLIRSLALAAGILFLILTLAFRSLRIGLITIVPNTFPLVLTAGGLRLSGVSLSFEAVTALVIALGIAVDDTVHLLARYRRERRSGRTIEEALGHSTRHVGTAMLLSTVIMTSGFAVVLTSELPATASFGALACITIGSALAGDLVLLPALLAAFDRKPLMPRNEHSLLQS